MPGRDAIITPATLRFFRDLKRNNRKEWMDANRDRYRSEVVEPFRALLSALAPHVFKLHPALIRQAGQGSIFRASIAISGSRGTKLLITPHVFNISRSGGGGACNNAALHWHFCGIRYGRISCLLHGAGKEITLSADGPSACDGQSELGCRGRRSVWGAGTRVIGIPPKRANGPNTKAGRSGRRNGKSSRAGWCAGNFRRARLRAPDFVAVINHLFRDVYPLFSFVSSTIWKPELSVFPPFSAA